MARGDLHICLRCGHTWIQRSGDSKPKRCGSNKCQSPYWDTPRKDGLGTPCAVESEKLQDVGILHTAEGYSVDLSHLDTVDERPTTRELADQIAAELKAELPAPAEVGECQSGANPPPSVPVVEPSVNSAVPIFGMCPHGVPTIDGDLTGPCVGCSPVPEPEPQKVQP